MKHAEIHSQQQRENPEPQEGTNPMPWFVIVMTALLLGFGVLYIARSAIVNAPALGDGRSTAELQGTTFAAVGTAVDGGAVYASRCVACHQASGAGLPGVFPPLAGSEWVTGKETTLVALVLHGASGALTVKGNTYNGAMPSFGAQLQDAELAAVLTHIRSQWGNRAASVTADTVATVRKETAARTEPFKGDAELMPLK
ncbi:MAG: cytochrome C oxidase Cbb3 [Betaproteobacteria bacterium HGW-Betaproteobacteria-3]|jgi:mono/diheme cytochrome c family protein|nr:MAG: cytochrome C oxidase Cbb3 [Betaproteobacteria bacterium HGW-Betaproteobacteria-3]